MVEQRFDHESRARYDAAAKMTPVCGKQIDRHRGAQADQANILSGMLVVRTDQSHPAIHTQAPGVGIAVADPCGGNFAVRELRGSNSRAA